MIQQSKTDVNLWAESVSNSPKLHHQHKCSEQIPIKVAITSNKQKKNLIIASRNSPRYYIAVSFSSFVRQKTSFCITRGYERVTCECGASSQHMIVWALSTLTLGEGETFAHGRGGRELENAIAAATANRRVVLAYVQHDPKPVGDDCIIKRNVEKPYFSWFAVEWV